MKKINIILFFLFSIINLYAQNNIRYWDINPNRQIELYENISTQTFTITLKDKWLYPTETIETPVYEIDNFVKKISWKKGNDIYHFKMHVYDYKRKIYKCTLVYNTNIFIWYCKNSKNDTYFR